MISSLITHNKQQQRNETLSQAFRGKTNSFHANDAQTDTSGKKQQNKPRRSKYAFLAMDMGQSGRFATFCGNFSESSHALHDISTKPRHNQPWQKQKWSMQPS